VEVYATYAERCKKLSVVEGNVLSEDVPDLHSDQEEADTRMMLHAVHASRMHVTSSSALWTPTFSSYHFG